MEGVKNELDFYSKFARPLIFSLPEAKDRVLAASWVKKIKEDENSGDKLKTDYIKLLLFALQRRKLVGIFTDDPTNYEKLEEFPDEYDLNTMAQELIEAEQKERRSNIRRQLQGQMGDFPPYTTDISTDFREYVAAQDIPGFGVHCYYAISKEPITSWQNADKGIFPKAAKSAVNTNSPLPPGSKSPDTCLSCPGPESTEPCTPGSPSADQLESDKRKKKSKKKLGNTPPVKPLVTGPQLEDDETRKPPTWSSNLIDVVERPRSATGAIPKVRSEKQISKKKGQLGDLDSDIEEDYNEMERALRDFQRGEIREQRRKREKRSKADDLAIGDSDDNEDEENVNVDYDLENFADLNQTEYEQELKEDSLLVQYFRDTINKRIVQKEKDSLKDTIRGTLPAQSGIPLTTPKPSVSPKRLKIIPPIYVFDEPLTRDTTKQTDTGSPKPTCSYSCSGRDPDMDKIFQEASAIAERIKDDLEPDYGPQQYQEEKIEEVLPPEPQAPPTEPIQRLTKGSSAAHKIFADVIPPLIEHLQPGPTEEPPYSSEMIENEALDMPMSPISNQDDNYIDSLFEGNRKTANTLKNISHMVSDVEPASFIPSSTQFGMSRTPGSKICSDQQSLSQSRQPGTQFQQSPPKLPEGGSTKVTQSSTRITTSMPVGESGRVPSPGDDKMFDFAKGYVPPQYMSPTGIGSESPPQFMSPGRGEAPSLRRQATPSRPQGTSNAIPAEQRICPSAKRRLNFSDVDKATFLDEMIARQKDLPFVPQTQQSPSDRRRMQIHGMDNDTFIAEAMARQKDLPPLPPDYAPQRTPPRTTGGPIQWQSPEWPNQTPPIFSQRASPSQMLSREQTPPFFDSPKTPDPNQWQSPERPKQTTPTFSQRISPSQMLSREQTPPFFDSPKTPVSPPFAAPYSPTANLFDTSMGDQYFSPPPLSPSRSPGKQQSPKYQGTPPFVAPDFTSGNLFDTTMGDLYYSPPASPEMSPRMQSPGQRFQPCKAQRNISGSPQNVSDVQQSRRRSSPQLDEFGLPPVAKVSQSRRSPSPTVPGTPPQLDEFGLPPVVQVSKLPKYQSPERRPVSPSKTSPTAGQGRSICPSVKGSMPGMDNNTLMTESMAQQQNLPPDYSTQRTPPRTGGDVQWKSPERPQQTTPIFSQRISPSQMLSREQTPPFFDSPKTPVSPPFTAPYSPTADLFDTSMGEQYFSPPPLSSTMSPGMQQSFGRGKTPPFVAPDSNYGNLFDTSMGDLYYSPPASPEMSPRMQSPGQRFQPCKAQRNISGSPQNLSDVQQSRRRSPPQLDEFGLPPVAKVSPPSRFEDDRFYERHPDLQSPERRAASSRTSPTAGQAKSTCPSVKRRIPLFGTDTDTFIAETMERLPNLPPLPPEYEDMRTPTRTGRKSPEMPWLKTPPNYGNADMLDAMNTPPFYDSPQAQTPGSSGHQYFSSSPASPDMSPGMQQMLNQLPQAQSFLRCTTDDRARQSRRRGGPALPTIAGSPPIANQSGSSTGRGTPSQNDSNYQPCPSSQGSRYGSN